MFIDLIYHYRSHPKDRGRYCFQFVSPHLDGGGGVPRPGLDGGGGYPGQVWMVEGGTPARSGWWGSYPGQVWTVRGGTLARSGSWGVPGVPPSSGPGLDGGGNPGQVWMVGQLPWPGLDSEGGYPSQVWLMGGTWSTSLIWARSGWWGVPQPGLNGGE